MTDREAIQGALEALDRYEHEPSHVGRERAVVEARDLLQAAIASQSAELAALRADAERLDFLHSHPTAITRSFGYRGAPDLWTSRGDYSTGRQSQDFASLRDAIDAAVAAHAAQG